MGEALDNDQRFKDGRCSRHGTTRYCLFVSPVRSSTTGRLQPQIRTALRYRAAR